MWKFYKIGCFILMLGLMQGLTAQPTLFFKKITVDQGLNDGAVQAIARDKMGYMWFSTIGGLNRYDGTSVRYFNQVFSDSGIVPLSICRNSISLPSGQLFFAFENGLAEFDFTTQTLRMVPSIGNTWVYEMNLVSDTSLFLATEFGLMRYNPITRKVFKLKESSRHQMLRKGPYCWTAKKGHVYLSYADGLYDYNDLTDSLVKLPMPAIAGGKPVSFMSMDGKDNLWLAISSAHLMIKKHVPTGNFKAYENLIPGGDLGIIGVFSHPLQDQVWIGTASYGVFQYIPNEDRFIRHENSPLQSWTINANLVRTIFFDDDGAVWLGGDYGVNYVNPGKVMFEIIPPFNTDITNRNRRMARVVSEDAAGNLWFGTLDGVVYYNKTSKVYQELNNRPNQKNKIFNNSVRGVLATNDGRVWITTGKGINRYNTRTQNMEFFDQKDSVSNGFYFCVNEDRIGNIWFSCRDGDGLYYYSVGDKKFHGIGNHPHLKKFLNNGFRYVMHDSKGRYWFAFNGQGLGMYNPANGAIETWTSVAGKHGAIAGNYLVDIKEDKTGKIWASTFNGLSCIDPKTFRVTNYTTNHGLVSNTTSALAVDSLNRLWIGTARGLMMLDSERKYFTSFGMADGLPDVAFPEYAAYIARNGDFILATANGYVRFNPMKFQPSKSLVPCYIDELNVLEKEFTAIPPTGENLSLKYFQNAINIKLVGINYDNPSQTWFAYKLEGFDKEWHYTQDAKAVYANLQGGHYKFLYKASANAYVWNIPANELTFSIATVFYKTIWFWILCGILIAGLLTYFYKLRMANVQQLYKLKSRTQVLEKEKALVMYENLKQHLNPHFLFNSLTSLSSLIRLDQTMAGNFLDRMSKIYRYILKNRDSEKVTLADEIEFVKHFIDLQKIRFEEGFEVHLSVDAAQLHRQIVPVTLQNLVENAIKHNTIGKSKPLVITITANDDYLLVSNNLQKKSFVETSNKQGLQYLKSLYQYLTNKPILVEEDHETFTIKIPLL